MDISALKDFLMTWVVIMAAASIVFWGYGMASDHYFESIKEKSPLHREVIAQYRDKCLQSLQHNPTKVLMLDQNALNQCGEEATELAISKGYADKLPGIFKDAAFHLTDDQLARLKAATPST